VGHFPAFEKDRDEDLVPGGQKLAGVLEAVFDVVGPGLRVEANLLRLQRVPVRLVEALFLPVFEPAEVEDAADRGIGLGRDLDQVPIGLFRLAEPFGQGDDPELAAVLGDESDFPGLNLFIFLGRTWNSSSPPLGP